MRHQNQQSSSSFPFPSSFDSSKTTRSHRNQTNPLLPPPPLPPPPGLIAIAMLKQINSNYPSPYHQTRPTSSTSTAAFTDSSRSRRDPQIDRSLTRTNYKSSSSKRRPHHHYRNHKHHYRHLSHTDLSNSSATASAVSSSSSSSSRRSRHSSHHHHSHPYHSRSVNKPSAPHNNNEFLLQTPTRRSPTHQAITTSILAARTPIAAARSGFPSSSSSSSSSSTSICSSHRAPSPGSTDELCFPFLLSDCMLQYGSVADFEDLFTLVDNRHKEPEDSSETQGVKQDSEEEEEDDEEEEIFLLRAGAETEVQVEPYFESEMNSTIVGVDAVTLNDSNSAAGVLRLATGVALRV